MTLPDPDSQLDALHEAVEHVVATTRARLGASGGPSTLLARSRR